jgi:glutathione S-transferase
MASQEDLASPFTLYTYKHSICAIMVQMTYAMRSAPREGFPEMKMEYRQVDISMEAHEQLDETFLCEINPNGVVPVLYNHRVLEKPMPESVDISYYICKWYPSLLPVQHEQVIRDLITELHGINYRLLTFGIVTKYPKTNVTFIKDTLARPDISDRYRKALEFKLAE